MIVVLGLDLASRAFWWLDVAIAIYAAVYLYSFFVQRRIVERIIELTLSPPPPQGPSPELPGLAARAQRGDGDADPPGDGRVPDGRQATG